MAARITPVENLPSKRLFIVDGHSYAYRAFYAIRQLSSPVTGKPTNAIYGFIRMLGKMRAYLQPTHIMVVWDGGLCEKRMALHPEYKEHRPSMPPLLEEQLDEISRYLQAANIPSFCREGIEADDWIATLTQRAVEQEFYVVIASADKDFLQLVSPTVGIINPNDKEPKIWKIEDVVAKTGVQPHQVVDWLSLLGDSVDNIPGVPGVGTTTATKLIQKFGSIEGVFARLDEVSPERIRLALDASRETLKRNCALILLHQDLPDVCCCDSLAVKPVNHEALASCYREWGFNTLLQELENQKGPAQGALL